MPAEPGRREPYANIPISILKKLNLKADIQAKKFVTIAEDTTEPPLEKDSHHLSAEDIIHKGSSVSEPDSQISASEWPPSPQATQLPPDSSIESPCTRATTNIQSLRSSSTSAVAHPRLSSPVGSPEPFTISGEPKETSPPNKLPNGLSSPIVEVIPIDERQDLPHPPLASLESSPAKSNDSLLEERLDEIHQDELVGQAPVHTDQGFQSQMVREAEPGLQLHASERNYPRQTQYKRPKKSSSVYSLPSSQTSDLEVTVPFPLDTEPVIQKFPSTASQPTEPFTQVKRTPYVNGQRHEFPPPMSKGLNSSPKIKFSHPSHEHIPNEEIDHVTQSAPSVMEQSDADVVRVTESEESSSGNNYLARLPIEPNDNEIDHMEQVQLPKRDQDPLELGNPQQRTVEPIETTPPKGSKNSRSPQANTEIHGQTYNVQDVKRKFYDFEPLSPNVAKRRKKSKLPVVLDYFENLKDPPDPLEGAKRYRQEFLASRRNGQVGVTDESFTSLQVPTRGTADIETDDPGHQGDPMKALKSSITDIDKHLREGQRGTSPGIEDGRLKERDVEASKASAPDLNPPGPQKELIIPDSNSSPEQALSLGAEPIEARPEAQDPDAMDIDADTLVDANTRELGRRSRTSSQDPSSSPMHPESQINASLSKPKDWNGLVPAASDSGNDQSTEVMDSSDEPRKQVFGDITHSPDQTGHPAVNNLNLPPRLARPTPPSKKVSRPIGPHLLEGVVPPIANMRNTSVQSGIPAAQTSPRTTSGDAGIFETFKVTYPAYLGDRKHFIAICKKIRSLLNRNRMEHPSLWDDFIVRHRTEYPDYLRRCAEEAEDPLSYEEFYREEIEQPQHQQRVVTRQTLNKALSLADLNNNILISNLEQNGFIPEHVPSTPSLHTASSVTYTPNSSGARVMINSTEDEDSATSSLRPKSISRSLSTDRVDHPHAKRNPRPLPWMKHGADSNPITSRNTTSRRSSPSSSEKLQQNTQHHVNRASVNRIQQNWGVTVENVLGSNRLDEMTPRFVELLAEISEMTVDILEGRKLISKQIMKTARSNRHEITLTIEDLETVRDRLLKKRALVPGHQPPPQRKEDDPNPTSQAPLSRSTEDETSGWWQDNSTPFKSYMMHYNNIRPGKGNSFFKPKSAAAEAESSSKVRKEARLLRKIDPLSWNL